MRFRIVFKRRYKLIGEIRCHVGCHIVREHTVALAPRPPPTPRLCAVRRGAAWWGEVGWVAEVLVWCGVGSHVG